MKRLFICEFITCGGMRDTELPAALLADAELMYQALLADLRKIGDIEIITCRDKRLSFVSESIVDISYGDDVWQQWECCMQTADLAWVIAPETDGVLLRLNKLARQSGCELIGCDDDAVELTASKQSTNDYLLEHGLPALTSRRLDDELLASNSGWIIKPDDGAGCEACHFFNRYEDLLNWKKQEENARQYIQQRYLFGTPISMAVLYGRQQTKLLSINRQMIGIRQGMLVNEGSSISYPGEYQTQLQTLATEIGRLIPGLHAYVGVDLVLTDSGPVIIEINPRLTTSYAGLSAILKMNAAELILNSHCGRDRDIFQGHEHEVTVGGGS